MTEKIALLVDSASDVPAAVIQKDNVFIVPENLFFGTTAYKDGQDLQPTEFYQKLVTTAELPTTSSPSIGDTITQLQRIKELGYTHVVGITISSGLSAAQSAFQNAAKEVPELKVAVLDTKNIGIGSGLFAVYASELLAQSLAFAEIMQKLQQAVVKSHIYFYIPSLKYLRAGGRIGRVEGLVGSLLHIKPVISCDHNGIYYPVLKVRTERKAIAEMVKLALKDIKAQHHIHIGIAHGANQPLAEKIKHLLLASLPEDTYIYRGEVSPVLGVHTGPGLVGIAVQASD